MVTLLLIALGWIGFSSLSLSATAEQPRAQQLQKQIVTGVRLSVVPSSVRSDSNKRTYEASVSDRNGSPISGATLDLGALQADPDIRVPTVAMTPSTVQGTYVVTVEFPSDGDWMLVVRVHEPSQAVELFTDAVVGAGAPPSHSDIANTPSRRALRAADPGFAERYNPTARGIAGVGSPLVSSDHHGSRLETSDLGSVGGGSSGGVTFNLLLSTTLVVIAHSVGACAWLIAVLGLAFANRVRSGQAQSAVFEFIAVRYWRFAGGGLALVAGTGLLVALNASAGLVHPSKLAATNIGTAYLAVFGLKMVLVAGAMVTSLRIARLMPTTKQFGIRNRLASAGAMSNDDPGALPNARLIFRLAETNAILAAGILGCVAVLGQLHHAIH